MVMDYHWDVFTTILGLFNLSKLLLVGNDNFTSFSVFFRLLAGFYTKIYENYKLWEMYFPTINRANEGNFTVFVLGVLNGVIEQGCLSVIFNWFLIRNEILVLGNILGILYL